MSVEAPCTFCLSHLILDGDTSTLRRIRAVGSGIDSDGELKMLDFTGLFAVVEMLKSNTTLQSIEYAPLKARRAYN